MIEEQSRLGTIPAETTAAASQGTSVALLDMSQLSTTYVNTFHACGSPRELILDFGLHSGLRMTSAPEPVHVTQRLIMPMTTVKQLLEFLHMLLRAQENLSNSGQATATNLNVPES